MTTFRPTAVVATIAALLLTGGAGAELVLLKTGVRTEGVIRRADGEGVEQQLRNGKTLTHPWSAIYAVREEAPAEERAVAATVRDPLAAATAYGKLAARAERPWNEVRLRLLAVQCLLRTGRTTDALDEFLAVTTKYPENVRFAETPEFAAADAEKLLPTLASCEAGTAPPIVRAVATAIRADLLLACGKIDEAEAAVKLLLRATDAQGVGLARVRTARIALSRGNAPRALELLESAERDLGTAFQPDLLWRKAQVLIAAGQTEKGLLAAAVVPARYPWCADRAARCLRLIAETRSQEYRAREAAAAWKWLVQDYPWSPVAIGIPAAYAEPER